jgi:hypothetical protein
MRLLRRLLRLKLLALALAALLGGVAGGSSGPAEYVPGPGNRYVPKPSCATVADPADKKAPFRFLAVCATTHGLVQRGPYPTRKEASRVADAIYDAEFAAQGGRLLR